MYLDLDANDNLPEAAMATFKETGAGHPIRAVRLLLDGAWTWCAVSGWDRGPVPALLTPIEESGDGPALLVHGGAQGLRLQRLSSPDLPAGLRWDTDDARQWGEPFLICRPETDFRS